MIGHATKIGMTRLFIQGKSVPVTAIRFGNSKVVQTKTVEKDGYDAVQVGTFSRKNNKNSSKSTVGHSKKHNQNEVTFRVLKEFRDVSLAGDQKEFTIADFIEGDELILTGKIKGRGFTGVVKRYGFRGQPKSHGHDHERAPGSIGAAWPQRVNKGTKMAGRSGGINETLRNVKVVAVDNEKNLIFVRGSIPGNNGNCLKIKKIIK
jgi:large subunit ribosomal protein L3